MSKQSKQHESHLKPAVLPLADGTRETIRAYAVRAAEFSRVPYPVSPCIVHRALPARRGRRWTVSDAGTGFAIGHGDTAAAAIAQAVDRLIQHGAGAYLSGLRRAGVPIGKLPFAMSKSGWPIAA